MRNAKYLVELLLMPNDQLASLIQRQLNAYNVRDINSWIDTYASDAKQYLLHGECIANGHAEIRARTLVRFAEPDLFAKLLSRAVMGNVVIDHEIVTRNFPEGKGTIEQVCIYEVKNERIHRASFQFGEKIVSPYFTV